MTAEATYVSLLSAGEIRKLIHQSIDERMPFTFPVKNTSGEHTAIEALFRSFPSKDYAVGSVLESNKPIAVIFYPESDPRSERPLVMTSHVKRATPTSPK